jgi:hypothetical protein
LFCFSELHANGLKNGSLRNGSVFLNIPDTDDLTNIPLDATDIQR